jgi:hypothetical protein
MRARTFGLASAVALFACSTSPDGSPVAVGPTLVFPRGVLDTVTTLSITMHDGGGGVTCNSATGVATGTTGKQPVASQNLGTTGCASGEKFCGQLKISKSSTPRVFSAVGKAADNSTVAVGCVQEIIDQDTKGVQIKMLRYAPPATCGGQQSPYPAVQCDPPGSAQDPLCDAECLTKEVWLSPGDMAFTSPTKQKIKPSLVWPAQSGDAGRMITFFGDTSPPQGRRQVSMRVLADDMSPFGGQGTVVRDFSFFLPTNPNSGIPQGGEAGSQLNPSGAAIGARYFVAYQDDASGAVAINLRSFNQVFQAEQAQNAPINVSTTSPQAQTLPSMAVGPGSALFVAWQGADGTIRGRTVNPSGFAKGTEQTLSSGGSNRNVVVAGTPSGWVAAWESGTDVKLRAIGPDGAPQGAEIKVNQGSGNQVHPGVAALPDGRVAVAWINGSAPGAPGIYVQRFSSSLAPVANDQADGINDLTKGDECADATIAAGSNFFVAAWVDKKTGHVQGRLLDGTTGFLFNGVNAQQSEFQASREEGRTRLAPAAAVGGSAPFVAIAWQDDTGAPGSYQGIFGRRFPAPMR